MASLPEQPPRHPAGGDTADAEGAGYQGGAIEEREGGERGSSIDEEESFHSVPVGGEGGAAVASSSLMFASAHSSAAAAAVGGANSIRHEKDGDIEDARAGGEDDDDGGEDSVVVVTPPSSVVAATDSPDAETMGDDRTHNKRTTTAMTPSPPPPLQNSTQLSPELRTFAFVNGACGAASLENDILFIATTSRGVRTLRLHVLPPPACLGGDTDAVEENVTMELARDVPVTGGGTTHARACGDLIAWVRPSSPRCASVFRFVAQHAAAREKAGNEKLVRDLHFVSAVRRVELNDASLAVLTADGKVHVFDAERTMERIGSVNVLHPSESARSVRSAADASRPGSFFDLSRHPSLGSSTPTQAESYLVCRDPTSTVGSVRVYDSKTLELLGNVEAHDNHGVARMAVGGPRGRQRLATASTRGTVIRIFSLPGCKKLHTLYRGSRSCAVHALSFDGEARRLAAAGSTGTVHMFYLGVEEDREGEIAGRDGSDAWRATDEGAFMSLTEENATKASSRWSASAGALGRAARSYLFPGYVDRSDGLRSYAKVKPRTLEDGDGSVSATSSPRAVALVGNHSGGQTVAGGVGCHLVICTDIGVLYWYYVQSDGSSRLLQTQAVLSLKEDR